MTDHFHAVVWIDHREAEVYAFGAGDVQHGTVHHSDSAHRIHHKANSMGSGHAHEDGAYLKSVADALGTAHEIVVCGPSAAKDEFVKWLETHAPQIRARIVGVEAMDHASSGEIVAFAKKYFARKDRMTPQIS